MDDSAFAEQLCAWIDPAAVLKAKDALIAIGHVPTNTRCELRIPRAIDLEPQAFGLDGLVRKFANGFHLPREYLQFLLPKGSEAVINTLERLRFGGELRFSEFGPHAPPNTAVVVSDNFMIAPLLVAPIQFLIRQTAQLVKLWATEHEHFFEHSQYSELLVFMEYAVASALGHEQDARSAETRARAQVLYGDGCIGISMVGEPPFGDLGASVRSSFEILVGGIERRTGVKAGAIGPQAGIDFDGGEVAKRPSLTSDDGFFDIDAERAGEPWRNIARWRDECSPYSMLRSNSKAGGLVVDCYYGRTFDFPLEENLGVYGITGAMREPPRAHEAQGFLRVPYRKIPRFAVRSIDELLVLLNELPMFGDYSNRLFRGQSEQHFLPRSSTAREILYGDSNAAEPSLLATATRHEMPLEAVLPAWVLLVRQYLQFAWGQQREMPAIAERVRPIIDEDARRLADNLDLQLYAISVAQHYGLPTMGLDVTEDLRTSLFFALHRSVREPNSRTIRFVRKPPGDAHGVLYAFAPDKRFRLVHDDCAPRTLGDGRPERQGAKFLVTGWGYHLNAAARHLGMAFDLDPAGDFGPLPTAGELFPPPEDDLFGAYLEAALEVGLPPNLRKYVEQLYWVADE